MSYETNLVRGRGVRPVPGSAPIPVSGIVSGENAQLQQLTPVDGMGPNECLEVVSFLAVYDVVAGDWNRAREGAVVGSQLTDLFDRAGRLVGIIYGNQGQLQQVAGTLELITQDTGFNTNPRRYEKENGFYSAPTTVGGAATALYTEATTPARTAGEEVTIYSLHIFNDTGAAGTIWLEIAGTRVTIEYAIADDDTVCVDWPAGLTLGDDDIDVNGTAGIVVQISGTEA